MSCLEQAKWISYRNMPVFTGDRRAQEQSAGQLLRREFVLGKKPVRARLTITGLGYYVAYVNGREVTDTVLNPGFTNYEKTVLYQVYDIDWLKEGRNCIAVSLGNGFYNAATLEVWNFINASWRDGSKLLLNLRVEYEDGTGESIPSDTRFRGVQGPVVFNAVRNGTIYDARLEQEGWTEPGFDDSGWERAVIVNAAPGVLKEQTHLPIRVMGEYGCEVKKLSPELWVFDAGINTAGWAKLRCSAPRGTRISLRYGERLYENGRLDVEDIARFCQTGEFQTDTYIFKGQGVEEFASQFAYHGFRYIQVICEGGIPEDLELTVQEVRSAMTERGSFTCSDEMINRIQAAVVQATKTNMHGIPTDCPHREKNGWTGDAQLSAEQALLNLNPMSIYNKWMDDFIDAQRPSGQLPGIIPSPAGAITGAAARPGTAPLWRSPICSICIPATGPSWRKCTGPSKNILPTWTGWRRTASAAMAWRIGALPRHRPWCAIRP